MADIGKIEYRVIPVTRYQITRYFEDGLGGGMIAQKGEYDNQTVAYEVAYALCHADQERYGFAVGDERIKYPDKPIYPDVPKQAS